MRDNAFSNTAWGFADGITFGLTRFARQSGVFGADTVNYTGLAYKAGMVTATGDALIGGAMAAQAAFARRTGRTLRTVTLLSRSQV